ncbi:LacI family DNA-binding transcriptional regulator [Lacicoccus alkaliphilus]|uniref:Transcriptional regulator, LacI family n=1 Tax=Lacicoccus alkaliphilus DSM 16010 TaxID=1123231 RepID=A0A1M7D031_9BACL|nr:LacI family DNA-binding transcriptional regulator [Salinicoccus alkaliphilus]SHL72773.1 transcriptional regulator, LacI family [Salinicoccus alkaliphilus DSM 16010]
MKRITIKDVAEHAGVSTSTVSQYINGRYSYMGEETKRRIEASVRELGYRPNFMARNLKKRSTRTIGIIVSNILHHFAVSVTRKIEDDCDADGYSLIICNADDDPVKEEKYINNLLEKQVDGLIIMPTEGNDALYRKLAEQKFPVVFIDRFMEGVYIPSFKLDNRHAVGIAYDYLTRQKVQNYYYIGASNAMDITPRTERLETFKKLAPKGKVITGENEELYNRIEEEFIVGRSNGIILANDFALMTFLEYAKQQELDLVESNKMIAIDDLPLAGVYNPGLPTIAQPIEAIAQNAYRQLMGVIEGESGAAKMVNNFKGKIVER